MNILITTGRHKGEKFSSSAATFSLDGRRVQIWIGRSLWEFMVGYECEIVRN